MGFEAANLKNIKTESERVKASKRLELGYEVLIAAGAVSVDTPVTFLETVGAIAITLADGYPGQVKTIHMSTDGGTATLTPTNLAAGTTIAFADVYDTWIGIFYKGTWHGLEYANVTVS